MFASVIRHAWRDHRRLHLRSLRNFYDWRTRSDSIYALATSIDPTRGSPLGVIRISGPVTARVLTRIVKRKPLSSKDATQVVDTRTTIRPRHATLSKLFDPRNDDLIDEGLVLWFPEPNSYTGEDTCELHVHGSRAVIRRFMTALGSIDRMRPAEPGEFTRRAVENGKLTLMQAEGLSDLIGSQTDRQRELALHGLSGSTRVRYQTWITRLMKILAHLEASIDFGEDELIGEQKVIAECVAGLIVLSKEISDFLTVSGRCLDMVRSGARIVILGRPNVGKSTFMNILCRQEKSIVSGLSGTTRDLVEHSFEMGGHKLTLCDTAGLKTLNPPARHEGKETGQEHDDIENEGIRRALDSARHADLIIYMIDACSLSKSSANVIVEEILEALKATRPHKTSKSIHLVINKIDLQTNPPKAPDIRKIILAIKNFLNDSTEVCATMISCKARINIDEILGNMTSSLDRLHHPNMDIVMENIEYVNERHLSLMQSASVHLEMAKHLDIRRIDEMAQHVRESVDYLSRIVGNVTNEQILDIVFRDFCIGK